MAAGIKRARGETERHARLKRLAFLWAQAQGYSACAMEVSLPNCRYRADVAVFRLAPKQIGSTAIFECKQALCDLRRDNCHRDDAQQRLDTFLLAVDHAELPAFDAFAKGIRSWQEELLAYFEEPTTNG